MPTNFNWNTDEEQSWENFDEPATHEPQRWRPPRWLISGGLVLAVLAGIGFLVARTVNRQVAEVTDDVSFTVLDAVALSQQAAASGDIDLFTSVLSGRDLNWSEEQKELVQGGLWLDRPQLGLALVAAAGSEHGVPRSEADVTLQPALRSAEINLTHIYQSPIGNGLNEQIQLQQTLIYRQGESSWLLAPPEEEFWGEQRLYNSPVFQATFPERDSPIATRLVDDLTKKFIDSCHLGVLEIAPENCLPPEPLAELSFSTSSRFLLELNGDRFSRPVAFRLADTYLLPTPSLVGIPLDEAGYQALYRGYAALLFGQMIQDVAGYRCCEHRLFFEAILQLELNTLGLQPWPLGLAEYQALLRHMPGQELESLFSVIVGFADPGLASVDLTAVYALVMYQRDQEGLAATEQIRRLNSAETLDDWLAPVAGPQLFSPAFYDSWRELFYRYANQNSQPPPIETSQAILLNCLDARRETPSATVLTSWSPATQQFTDWSFHNSTLFMMPLPADDGLILHENVSPLTAWSNLQAVPNASRTTIWQAGLERQMNQLGLAAPRLTFSGLVDPAGQLFLMRQSGSTQGLRRVDLNQCENGCLADNFLEDFNTYVVRWAPDGQRALQGVRFLDGNSNERQIIWLANGQLNAGEAHAEGNQPFWLSAERYGYFQGQEVFIQDLSESSPSSRSLIEIQRPNTIIDSSPLPLEVASLAQNPVAPNELLILWTELSRGRHFLLWYDVANGEQELLFDSTFAPDTYVLPETLGFSGDGRWLKYVLDDGQAPDMLLLQDYPIRRGRSLIFDLPTASYLGHDWSADGAWLAISRGITIELISLYADEQWELPLEPHLHCNQLAWQTLATE